MPEGSCRAEARKLASESIVCDVKVDEVREIDNGRRDGTGQPIAMHVNHDEPLQRPDGGGQATSEAAPAKEAEGGKAWREEREGGWRYVGTCVAALAAFCGLR